VGNRFAEIAALIEEASAIEQHWRLRDQFRDDVHIPFIPFPVFDRIAMLAEAAPLIPQPDPDVPPRYLEPGCGGGSGLVVAGGLFGMNPTGFELNEAMAASARDRGLDVVIADAFYWHDYKTADFTWYNAVFRDPAQEEALERRIWHELAPGSVLACVNTQLPPPPDWFIILDAADERRWISLKPPGRL
jgi:trans-aconitate methyltransferase